MTSECSICLDGIDVKVTGCTEMACGHKFHLGCVGKWLSEKDNCPLCRTPPSEKEKLYSNPVTGMGSHSFLLHNIFNLMVDRSNINIEEYHVSINSAIIPDIFPNDEEQNERDITLVMTQSGINNRELAVEILSKNHGDIVDTIMELTAPPFIDGGTGS